MMVLFSHWSFVPGVFQFCFFVILERNMKHGIFFSPMTVSHCHVISQNWGSNSSTYPQEIRQFLQIARRKAFLGTWDGDPFAGLKFDANPSTTSRIKQSDRIGYPWLLSDKHR